MDEVPNRGHSLQKGRVVSRRTDHSSMMTSRHNCRGGCGTANSAVSYKYNPAVKPWHGSDLTTDGEMPPNFFWSAPFLSNTLPSPLIIWPYLIAVTSWPAMQSVDWWTPQRKGDDFNFLLTCDGYFFMLPSHGNYPSSYSYFNFLAYFIEWWMKSYRESLGGFFLLRSKILVKNKWRIYI